IIDSKTFTPSRIRAIFMRLLAVGSGTVMHMQNPTRSRMKKIEAAQPNNDKTRRLPTRKLPGSPLIRNGLSIAPSDPMTAITSNPIAAMRTSLSPVTVVFQFPWGAALKLASPPYSGAGGGGAALYPACGGTPCRTPDGGRTAWRWGGAGVGTP